MGELLQTTGGGANSSLSLVYAMLSVAALAVFALVQNVSENNDDDDSPGGGLMQPVA